LSPVGRDRVEAAAVARYRPAPDLAERLGHAVEDLGPLPDHPLGTHDPRGLLIREEREQQRPPGHDPLPAVVADHREHHADHVLHVDGASSVEPAVADLTGERRDGPVLGDRGDDVDVSVHDQSARVRVGSLDPGEQAPSSGNRLHEFAGDADLVEVLGDPAAHPRLAVADRRGITGVGRVDGDEVGRDRDGLRAHPLPGLVGHLVGVGHPKHFPSPR